MRTVRSGSRLPRGVLPSQGGASRVGLLPSRGGGIPARTEADPPWSEWQTGVKNIIFVADGKNK